MNPKLREFLINQCNMKADSSEADAQRYYEALTGDSRRQADQIIMLPPAPPQPPAPPAPPQQTAPTPQQVESIRKEEQKRIGLIDKMASRYKLSAEWVQAAKADTNKDIGTLTREVAELQLTDHPNVPGAGGQNVEVGSDLNRGTLATAMCEAMMARSSGKDQIPEFDKWGEPVMVEDQEFSQDRNGAWQAEGRVKMKRLSDRAREFRGLRPVRMAERFLRSIGVPGVDQMSDVQISQLVFDRHVMARYNVIPTSPQMPPALMADSTSDYPSIYLDAQGKSLRRAYVEAPRRWPLFCNRVTVPDFKDRKVIMFSEAANLLEVKEFGEFKVASFSDLRETYKAIEWGRRFQYSWRMIVDDELGAMDRLLSLWTQAAVRKEDELAFGQLTSNPTLTQDNVALFHTTHANIAVGADIDPPNVTTLNAAAAAMMSQTGLGGIAKVEIEPAVILAGAGLMGTIKALLSSTGDPASSNSNVANIWQGMLRPVFSSYFAANEWYLTANPASNDTIEMAFLDGFAAPTIETEEAFIHHGRSIRVWHVVNAHAVEFRTMYKNAGT